MPPEIPKKSAADLAELLNRRFGGNAITTAGNLPDQPVPQKWKVDSTLGENLATPMGGVFVRTEFFPATMLHGDIPLSRLDELPGKDWSSSDEPVSGIEDPEKLVFLDTETTGLGRECLPFLIGLGRWKRGEGFHVTQLFLERNSSEAAHFDHAARVLSDGAAIVTYNGASFDMPLIEAGFLRNRLIYTPGDLPHLDLLPHARAHWRRKAGSCKLTNLERLALKFERVGDVPGKLIPALYSDYLRRGNSDALSGVFFHNALDILSLAALMTITPPKSKSRSEERPPSQAQARKSTKVLIAELQSRGDYTGALAEAEKLMATGFGGHPYPFLEAAKILEKGLGEKQRALDVIEAGLRKPWIPKDREALEKVRARLASTIFEV